MVAFSCILICRQRKTWNCQSSEFRFGIFGQTRVAAGGEMHPNYFKNRPLYDTSSREIADLALRLLTISRFQILYPHTCFLQKTGVGVYFSCTEFHRGSVFWFSIFIFMLIFRLFSDIIRYSRYIRFGPLIFSVIQLVNNVYFLAIFTGSWLYIVKRVV